MGNKLFDDKTIVLESHIWNKLIKIWVLAGQNTLSNSHLTEISLLQKDDL